MDRKLVNLFHIVFVFPLFLWVGLQKDKTPFFIWPILAILGVFVTIAHINGAIMYRPPLWVHALHFLIVGPLLMYIGWHGKETGRTWFEAMLLLAFGAIGYHTFSYYKY
jgi:hypothetical protein